MIKRVSRWRSLAAGSGAVVAIALAQAGPALASAPLLGLSPAGVSAAGVALAGASCSTPSLSQPFAAWGDENQYMLAPGQGAAGFNGSGWALYGTASIAQTTALDGSSRSVLDLPFGGVAISAPVCVASDYPLARTMIETDGGANVAVGVVYADAIGAGVTESVLQSGVSGAIGGSLSWAPSPQFEVHPGNLSGWQVVQFVFANLSGGNAELYDFYVDPRMSD